MAVMLKKKKISKPSVTVEQLDKYTGSIQTEQRSSFRICYGHLLDIKFILIANLLVSVIIFGFLIYTR